VLLPVPNKPSTKVMIAYEFYCRDKSKGNQLIGILPERRKDPGRINHLSIMNWGSIVFGGSIDVEKIFYVPVILDKTPTGKYFSLPAGEAGNPHPA
jgi:hypothetical protein